MAINEQWLPVVTEVVTWVKNNFGSSKKELKMQISDLDKQVRTLADGNAAIINNMSLIIQAILSQIKSDNGFAVNADTIVLVGENTGSIDIPKTTINMGTALGDVALKKQVVKIDYAEDFFVSDDEIVFTRTNKPRDRR